MLDKVYRSIYIGVAGVTKSRTLQLWFFVHFDNKWFKTIIGTIWPFSSRLSVFWFDCTGPPSSHGQGEGSGRGSCSAQTYRPSDGLTVTIDLFFHTKLRWFILTGVNKQDQAAFRRYGLLSLLETRLFTMYKGHLTTFQSPHPRTFLPLSLFTKRSVRISGSPRQGMVMNLPLRTSVGGRSLF